MRRWLILLLLVFVILLVWWRRQAKPPHETVYVGERSATLWSRPAQVRQPVATVRYGERVAVIQRRGRQAEVRTAQGVQGWLETQLLMEPALWQRSVQLLEQAREMPVQARRSEERRVGKECRL